MRTPTPLLDRPPAREPVPPPDKTADRRTLVVLLLGLLCGALLVLGLFLLLGDSDPEVAPPEAGTDQPEPAPPTDVPTPEAGAPPAVVEMVERIEVAARAGDWDALAALAMEGDTPFWGVIDLELSEAELAAHWRDEAQQQPLADLLVGLLAVPDWYETTATAADGSDVPIHVTPRFMHEPTAESRAALEAELGAEYVEGHLADGQYLGYRLGVTADGDWRFFVTGD
jgi:hypothetical protein